MRVDWCVLFAALAASAPARADCDTSTGRSPCFDADNLWLRATSDTFIGIDGTRALDAGDVVLAMATGFAQRPVMVLAPSPDPEGRELEVVAGRWGVSLLAAYSPLRPLELSLELPVVAYQNGSGLSGLTTRGEVDLRSTTLRDPRLGVGWAVFDPEQDVLGLRAWLDLVLPLGDEAHFAGEAGFVFGPSVSAEIRVSRFFAGALARARLRERTEFSGATFGPQLELALGAGVDLLRRDLLALAAEARVLPVLASQEASTRQGEPIDSTFVPAEWLVSIRSAPWSAAAPTFRASGGTALPLSTRTFRDTTDVFAGLTSPELRLLLSVHQTLGASEPPSR